MVILINVGRFLMLAWVLYALVLIWAPRLVHQSPNQMSGIIQVLVAFGIGHSLDRLLGAVRRRRAEEAAQQSASNEPSSSQPGGAI
jgi:hypothetical protein